MSELTADEKAALTACLKSILPTKSDEDLGPVISLVESMKEPPVEESVEEVAGPAKGGRRRRKTKRPRRKGRKSRQSARM